MHHVIKRWEIVIGSGAAAIERQHTTFQYVYLNTNFRPICHRLVVITTVTLGRPKWTPHFESSGVRRELKMVGIEILTQHSYSTSIHIIGHRSVVHHLGAVHFCPRLTGRPTDTVFLTVVRKINLITTKTGTADIACFGLLQWTSVDT